MAGEKMMNNGAPASAENGSAANGTADGDAAQRRPCSCAKCQSPDGLMELPEPSDLVEDIAQLVAGRDPSGRWAVPSREHRQLANELYDAIPQASEPEVFVASFEKVPEAARADVATKLLIETIDQSAEEACDMLLNRYGACTTASDQFMHGSALMHAANVGSERMVDLLVKAGAELNAVDDDKQTALVMAVLAEHSTVVAQLVRLGAEVDKLCQKSMTALGYACKFGNCECIKALTAGGANVLHMDEYGLLPLDHAQDSGKQEAIDLVKALEKKAGGRPAAAAEPQLGATSGTFVPVAGQPPDSAHTTSVASSSGLGDATVQLESLKIDEASRAEAIAAQLLQEEQEAAASESSKASKKKAKKKAKKDKAKEAAGEQQLVEQAPVSVEEDFNDAIAASPEALKDGHGKDESVAWMDAQCALNANELQGKDKGKDKEQGMDAAAVNEVAGAGSSSADAATTTVSSGAAVTLAATATPEAGAVATSKASHVATNEAIPTGLRKEWEELLARSTVPGADEQAACIAAIVALMPRVAAAGISTKYGKKVLAKLEKVAPVREELEAVLVASVDGGNNNVKQLGTVVERAKQFRAYLEPKLLGDAEALLAQRTAAEEAAKWAKLQANLGDFKQPANSGAPPPLTPASQSVATAPPPFRPTYAPPGSVPKPPIILSAPMAAHVVGGGGQEGLDECVCCYLEGGKTHVCVPCGHQCMCAECAAKIEQGDNLCPVCRTELEMIIEV